MNELGNRYRALDVDHDITSRGHLDVGSLAVRGTYTTASGASDGISSSLSATSVIVESGGSLGISGTVASSITNTGTVTPGIVTVAGNYTQTASAALSESFGYATLNVKQNAALSGALNVTFSPKHPPQSGAKYTAVTFGSLSGRFTSHTTGFALTTNATNIVVTKQ